MIMTKKAIRIVQEYLADDALYTGDIDGLCGEKTMEALHAALEKNDVELPQDWRNWSKKRKLTVYLQLICKSHGIETGPVDGLWGQQTDFAYESLLYFRTYGSLPDPWRDIEGSDANPHNWPGEQELELVGFYGNVGENLTMVELPYVHRLSWDKSIKLSRFTCHEKVHDSIQRVLARVLDHYGEEAIKKLQLDLFGGCFNKRRKRGGTSWSTHSWGIALDYNPDSNRLSWGREKAAFAKPEYDKWWELWEAEGWVGLGRTANYDWMHVQAARR